MLHLLGEYAATVWRYWWALIPGLLFTLISLVAYIPRIRDHEEWIVNRFRRWFLAVGIVGLLLAQFLAWKDMRAEKYAALAGGEAQAEQLSQRVADLERELERTGAVPVMRIEAERLKINAGVPSLRFPIKNYGGVIAEDMLTTLWMPQYVGLSLKRVRDIPPGGEVWVEFLLLPEITEESVGAWEAYRRGEKALTFTVSACYRHRGAKHEVQAYSGVCARGRCQGRAVTPGHPACEEWEQLEAAER